MARWRAIEALLAPPGPYIYSGYPQATAARRSGLTFEGGRPRRLGCLYLPDAAAVGAAPPKDAGFGADDHLSSCGRTRQAQVALADRAQVELGLACLHSCATCHDRRLPPGVGILNKKATPVVHAAAPGASVTTVTAVASLSFCVMRRA